MTTLTPEDRRGRFETALGKPCSKCSKVLTDETQSLSNPGHCKSCSYAPQLEYKKRKFTEHIGTSCTLCRCELDSHNQSQVYPGICKPCTNPWFRETNRKSVQKRILSNVGKLCSICTETTLTEDNQAKSKPGACKPCVNKISSMKIKLNRPVQLNRSLGEVCRICNKVVLTSENQSRALSGGCCKGCASAYAKSKRTEKIVAQVTVKGACRTCDAPLGPTNISRSDPRTCKTCHSKNHQKYVKRILENFKGNPCISCHTILNEDNQSFANPKKCKSCLTNKLKATFENSLGGPCVKCEITLTTENQSRGHAGKCKSCRNAELICVVCGNKGGTYRGKKCKTCTKLGA